jgi:hypothetical protein
VISILLIQMIINDIEVNGATQKEYAHTAGVAETTINRFINKKISLGFDSVLSIIKDKFPDYEEKIMMDYMIRQDNQNARLSLEYCIMNQLPEIADQLIEKLKNSQYVANKEWGKVYEIERMRIKKEISPQEVIARVLKIDAKSKEMKIQSKILELYANFDLEKYTYLEPLIIGLEQRIEDCNSIFMKRSFKLRLGQALSYISLYNNEVATCRYYANMIIENTDNSYFKAIAYQTLGISYLFENFEESLSFFQHAIHNYEISKKVEQIKIVLRNINFSKCFWNTNVNTCNINLQSKNTLMRVEFYDIVEVVFYAIRVGEVQKAKEMLDTIDLSKLTDWNKGYYYYYRALENNDNIDLYFKSIKHFLKSGDKFHLQLPLKKLKKLGERESILEVFTE